MSNPFWTRCIYKFVRAIILQPEQIFAKIWVSFKFVILDMVYPISLRGHIFHAAITILYCMSLSYLFSLGYVVSATDVEFPPAALPKSTDFNNYSKSTLEAIGKDYLNEIEIGGPALLYMLVENFNMWENQGYHIPLSELGIFQFNPDYQSFSSHFPMFKMSDRMHDYKVPYAKNEELTSLCESFLVSTKEPTLENVTHTGTVINLLYKRAITTLADPKSPEVDIKFAWLTLIAITPAIFEYQIVSFNPFLEIIGYPLRVEDYVEGSAYQRSGMYTHIYKQSYADPYTFTETTFTEFNALHEFRTRKFPAMTVSSSPITDVLDKTAVEEVTEKIKQENEWAEKIRKDKVKWLQEEAKWAYRRNICITVGSVLVVSYVAYKTYTFYQGMGW